MCNENSGYFLIVLPEGHLCFAIWALIVSVMIYRCGLCLRMILVMDHLRCRWLVTCSFGVYWMVCLALVGGFVRLMVLSVASVTLRSRSYRRSFDPVTTLLLVLPALLNKS